MSDEFVVGGKVECVNNEGLENCLSVYKVYEVLEVLTYSITIKDDKDLTGYYSKERFTPHTNMKINTTDNSTVIKADELNVTDKEGNITMQIDNTGEPHTLVNGELKPMLSMTDEDIANQISLADAIKADKMIIQLPSDINVLGTTYTIEVKSIEEDSYLDGIYGYCDFLAKSIVLRELNMIDYQDNIKAINVQYKTNLRHELMHAFLYESGLDSSTLDAWARNEEMIDYMALQLPKIFKVFNECGIIE